MYIPTNMSQWRRSWIGGKQPRRIIMVSTDTINEFFSVCYFCQWHAREGSPGRTRGLELNHVRKNGRNHFARAGLDKRLNCNCGCKIVLTYDPWSFTAQSPMGQGARLGTEIGVWVGPLNFALA